MVQARLDRALGKPELGRDLGHGEVSAEAQTDQDLLVRGEPGDGSGDLIADGQAVGRLAASYRTEFRQGAAPAAPPQLIAADVDYALGELRLRIVGVAKLLAGVPGRHRSFLDAVFRGNGVAQNPGRQPVRIRRS
jgi:hypothetical protein